MPVRSLPTAPTRTPTDTPRRAAPSARKAAPPRPATRAVPAAPIAARKARPGTRLPGWDDLAPATRTGSAARAEAGARKATQLAERKATERKAAARALDAVPSLRFGFGLLLVCLAATLFVAHVYATRATLADLQTARRDGERLRLTEQRLRGELDRMTGPAAVMPRALALGLVEGVAYGVPITLTAPRAD